MAHHPETHHDEHDTHHTTHTEDSLHQEESTPVPLHDTHTAEHQQVEHGRENVDAVKEEAHKTQKNISRIIPLGEVADKRLTVKEVGKGIIHDTKNMALAILDLGKDIVHHVKNTAHDIKQVPGIAGKTTLSLASLLKLPLESSVSVLEMLVKQGQSLGNMVAHSTAWKRIPTPVTNIIRAPFKAVGWLFSPFRKGNHPHELPHTLSH